MLFKMGISVFSNKVLDIHDWKLSVMRVVKIKGYITPAHTLFSGVGEVLHPSQTLSKS